MMLGLPEERDKSRSFFCFGRGGFVRSGLVGVINWDALRSSSFPPAWCTEACCLAACVLAVD